ncbi:MAG: hypothetical protein JWO30_4736, partial [Fibrobacteres bacterium]|nr:hypothetical protein [Fibrobacterota bacterium]
QAIYVEKFQNYQYAHFAFAAPVECVVTVKDKIDSFTVHPRIRGIQGRAEGNVLRFTLSPDPIKPGYLVVNIDKLGKLVLLGDKPETDAPNPAGAKVRVITAAPYNADSSGKTNVTAVIQKALDDIGAAGGGILYFPPGVFQVIKTLQARSGVSMYLAPGARIRSSANKADFGAAAFLAAMIETNGVSDFRIFGRGTWDASGMALMNRDDTSNRRRLFSGGGLNKNITLEGVILRDATTWTIVMHNADSCLVRHVKLLNHWDQSEIKIQNDGIDLCGSRHGTADANFVITGDDAMCAKGDGNETAYLTFKNNIVLSFAAGNKVGMQSTAPVHDILFSNNDVVSCRRGIVVESLEGALPMTKIKFENISIDGYQSLPGWAQRTVEFLAENAKISDVEISNTISYVSKDSQLDGMGNGIQNVTFLGLWLENTPVLSAAQGRLTLTNATDIAFQAGSPPSSALAGHPRRFPLPGSARVAGGLILAPGSGYGVSLQAYHADGKQLRIQGNIGW